MEEDIKEKTINEVIDNIDLIDICKANVDFGNGESQSATVINMQNRMEEEKILINIPAEGNYIEILGHKIDGYNSFEEFLEELRELQNTRERNKELEEDYTTVYLKGVYDERDKWKNKIKEKIEELDSIYQQEIKQQYNGRYYHQLSYAIQVLQELLED